MTRATFFANEEAFRAWLEEHHGTASELLVGFHKRSTGRPSITWPESVDAALCFGWIDGVRRSLGPESYTIRFSPRRPRSVWSAKNIARMTELIGLGRVAPAGLDAFERRTADRSGRYSFEQGEVELPASYLAELRGNEAAWVYFQAQPPYYRRVATWWVVSAKREDTRRKRLATLIRDSAASQRIGPLRRP